MCSSALWHVHRSSSIVQIGHPVLWAMCKQIRPCFVSSVPAQHRVGVAFHFDGVDLPAETVALIGCFVAHSFFWKSQEVLRHHTAESRRARVLGALWSPQLWRPLAGAAVFGRLKWSAHFPFTCEPSPGVRSAGASDLGCFTRTSEERLTQGLGSGGRADEVCAAATPERGSN
jgi:hypothetical protein